MRKHLAIILFCALALLSSTARAEDKWIKVQTPHFLILSNGSQNQATAVAMDFERIRALLSSILPNLRTDSSAQDIIFALKDEGSFVSLVPFEKKQASTIAGQFFKGWEKDYIFVRLDVPNDQRGLVYHAYVQKMMSLNFTRVPDWLSEGLGEFFGNTGTEKGDTLIGAPTGVIRAILRQNRIDSIRYILSTRESSLLNEGQAKNAVFEAESWALTHFLILGPNMGNGQQMTKLLNLLQKHISGIDAFQQIFGDPDKLDGVLDRYIGNPQLGVFVYKPTRNVDASTFSAGAMTPAETDAELGGAYVRLHQSDSAITRLKAAISEDPQSALAHENLAILDFDQGKDDDAQQEFDRAVALNPKSYLAIYYEAMLAYNGKTDGDSLNKLDAALQNVLQLNPSFAPAVVVRSRISAQQQKLQDAVDLAEQSQKLEPDRAGYATNLAAILVLGHDYKDAAKIAEATAARWSGSDSAEALAVLKAARTEGNIAATPEEEQDELKEMKYAEGMLETAGVIKSITCVPSKPIEVVLQVSDRLLTFRTAKGSGFGFSDTIWYGEDHFSVCHHLEGMRAVIRYIPPQNANDPVEFKWAEIRDQLVPSSPPLPTN